MAQGVRAMLATVLSDIQARPSPTAKPGTHSGRSVLKVLQTLIVCGRDIPVASFLHVRTLLRSSKSRKTNC